MPIIAQTKSGQAPDTGAPLTAAELAPLIGADDDLTRAGHLLDVAWTMVQQYAPRAPETVKREAIIRLAGYLAQADYGTIVKESLGPHDVEYTANHANAFRNCGAAMLLTRWRVRRAGAI